MKNDVHEQHKWSDKNIGVLDTDDWEIAVIGNLGGGTLLGAGYATFAVRSARLKAYARLVFVGAGAGAGVYGGRTMPPTEHYIDCSMVDWFSLRKSIAEPFSLSNWCNADGRVSTIAIASPGALGWGYTRMIVTAVYEGPKRKGYLFDKHHLAGTGVGTGGLGLGVMWGAWRLLDIPKEHQIDADWTKPVCKT
jgi:hypothetical protein